MHILHIGSANSRTNRSDPKGIRGYEERCNGSTVRSILVSNTCLPNESGTNAARARMKAPASHHLDARCSAAASCAKEGSGAP